MKRIKPGLIAIIMLLVLLSMIAAASADVQRVTITASNTWSDRLRLNEGGAWGAIGSGWVATVRLQACIPGDACGASESGWFDTGDTIDTESTLLILEGADLFYRVGVKTGEFTSGSVVAWIKTRF